MMRVLQTFPSKVPLVAFATIVLHTLTACGKVSETASIPLPPAVQIAESVSLTGKVTLTGGRPAALGQTIDVGGNPFCTGHGALINPTWRIADDGGLRDVVISVRQTQRASNVSDKSVVIDQKNCEFQPYLSVVQSGQSVNFKNSDLTFHNIRIVRHQPGTRGEGENLVNLAQPAQGDSNTHTFTAPGIYRLECDVHRWMRAWVVVHEGAHITTTGADGMYSLNRALADGTYDLSVWHPMFARPLTRTVTIHSGRATADFSFDLAQSFDS
jgi:plastocyanin